jgi:hypothetical protein
MKLKISIVIALKGTDFPESCKGENFEILTSQKLIFCCPSVCDYVSTGHNVHICPLHIKGRS